MDVTARLARRLHQLRQGRGWSLDDLARESGVSRSNISLVERGESSPTATVLDRLATALGVTLAELFQPSAGEGGAPSPLARAAEQPTWTDPGSGYLRRTLSPPGRSGLQLVEVRFPAGKRVAYETAEREPAVEQQVWLLEGAMEVTVGEARHRLGPGDCLAMRLDRPTAFRNPGKRPARYLVALASQAPAGRGGRR